MKALYIPASILAVLLALSLWSSAYLQHQADTWITEIEDITAEIKEERWDKIASHILDLYQDWGESQSLFHLILAHEDLDEAEKYFAGALAACQEEDNVELHILLEQLASQMTYLADTQEVTLKNIL